MRNDRKIPLLSRGGVDARPGRSREATTPRADGVVLFQLDVFLTKTTPAFGHPSSTEEGNSYLN
jgi:hypothetical protein